MSKSNQSKGPVGLRMLSVMFAHPDECFLSEDNLKKARYLDLKFAKAFLVDRTISDGVTVKMVKAVMYTRTGIRYSSELMPAPGHDDDLTQWLEIHLNEVYANHTQALVQRLQSK